MTNATIEREHASIHALSVEDFKTALDEQHTGWLKAILHYGDFNTEQEVVAHIKGHMIWEEAEEQGIFDDYEEEEVDAVIASTEFETCDYYIRLHTLCQLLSSVSEGLKLNLADGSLSTWCESVTQYHRYPESCIQLEGVVVESFEEFKQGMDSIVSKMNARRGVETTTCFSRNHKLTT